MQAESSRLLSMAAQRQDPLLWVTALISSQTLLLSRKQKCMTRPFLQEPPKGMAGA